MNKDERNKFVAVITFWIESFIPHLLLTPQVIVIKQGKKDRAIFDCSFIINDHSPRVNLFASVEDECNLECGTALKSHLDWGHNIHISHPHEEIFTFDDDVSGAFKHAKFHLDVGAAHS